MVRLAGKKVTEFKFFAPQAKKSPWQALLIAGIARPCWQRRILRGTGL